MSEEFLEGQPDILSRPVDHLRDREPADLRIGEDVAQSGGVMCGRPQPAE